MDNRVVRGITQCANGLEYQPRSTDQSPHQADLRRWESWQIGILRSLEVRLPQNTVRNTLIMDTVKHVTLPLHESKCRSLGERQSADDELQATLKDTDGFCFAIQHTDSSTSTIFTLEAGHLHVHHDPSSSNEAQFTLTAQSTSWTEFFAAMPKRPYQAYWGMMRVLGKQSGVEVLGDQQAFTKYARVWRIVLDYTRNAIRRPSPPSQQEKEESYIPEDELDDDCIVGHYTWLTLPTVGKTKIFYEVSGTGTQPLLFLHTAGADARQFHSLMLDNALQQRCKMYAFDLPGHGRSFPGAKQHPLAYANTEGFYVGCISLFLQKLDLKSVIVSGASMGGQICLSLASRAQTLSVRGVIPCEACDYIPSVSGSSIYSLTGDESVLNAERVCGMISPTSPGIYKRLNWWIYSSQASRIFPGDLQFYFDGWDGRGRMGQLDTEVCTVYMLTGEYDYSCTPDMSRATAERIKLGRGGENLCVEEMEGLGHFPFSEDPERFLPCFRRALEFVLERSRKGV